jgi:hypothetical protein
MMVKENIVEEKIAEITGWYCKWIIICRIFHGTSWAKKYFSNKWIKLEDW